MESVVEDLDSVSSRIRFEVLDFSVGELIRLHNDKEIEIQPDFQRLFRWTQAQQSRLIESLLLGLPVPQIVLFQRPDGVLELIDGLQRVSSLIRFVTGKSPRQKEPMQAVSEEVIEQFEDEGNTALEECDILNSLNGKTYNDLESLVQLELKRKALRAIVIRRTNDPWLRYEMFKRLNAGGSPAEPHEVRNASLRILGAGGERLLKLLNDATQYPAFFRVTETLSDQSKQRLGRQELVLRFFALKNFRSAYRGHISDWLDSFGEKVATSAITFDYEAELTGFKRFFDIIDEKLGDRAFVKHKAGRPIGGLAPAYFDAVCMGLWPMQAALAMTDVEAAHAILAEAVDTKNEKFMKNVGPGGNVRPRMERRITLLTQAFAEKLGLEE